MISLPVLASYKTVSFTRIALVLALLTHAAITLPAATPRNAGASAASATATLHPAFAWAPAETETVMVWQPLTAPVGLRLFETAGLTETASGSWWGELAAYGGLEPDSQSPFLAEMKNLKVVAVYRYARAFRNLPTTTEMLAREECAVFLLSSNLAVQAPKLARMLADSRVDGSTGCEMSLDGVVVTQFVEADLYQAQSILMGVPDRRLLVVGNDYLMVEELLQRMQGMTRATPQADWRRLSRWCDTTSPFWAVRSFPSRCTTCLRDDPTSLLNPHNMEEWHDPHARGLSIYWVQSASPCIMVYHVTSHPKARSLLANMWNPGQLNESPVQPKKRGNEAWEVRIDFPYNEHPGLAILILMDLLGYGGSI